MKNVGMAVIHAAWRNPAAMAGLCMFAVAFSMVANNAINGQKGGHPVPLFATRDAMITRSLPANTESAAPVRAVPPLARETQIPLPEMRPQVAAPAPVQQEAPQRAQGTPLVRDIQSELARKGLYAGSIDGLYGPMTREAIRQFEQRSGMAVTGKPSTELLERITAGPARGAMVEQASFTVAEPERREAPAVPQAAVQRQEPVRELSLDLQEIRDAALVARVQIGLSNFGEDIVPDGVMGDGTVAAIRKFQSRFGLDVTGQPDDELIRKMEEIGILKRG